MRHNNRGSLQHNKFFADVSTGAEQNRDFSSSNTCWQRGAHSMGVLFVFFLTSSAGLVVSMEVLLTLSTVLSRLKNGVQILQYPSLNILGKCAKSRKHFMSCIVFGISQLLTPETFSGSISILL